MIKIIVPYYFELPYNLQQNSIIIKDNSVICGSDKNLIVYSNNSINGFFDIVIVHGDFIKSKVNNLDSSSVVFLSSSDKDSMYELSDLCCNVVTIGFSEKDTVCISSNNDEKCSFCIQRQIPFKQEYIDVQECLTNIDQNNDLFQTVCLKLLEIICQ